MQQAAPRVSVHAHIVGELAPCWSPVVLLDTQSDDSWCCVILVVHRHTHIDIDGRNAIYTTHLFGRGEAGGRVERVNTLSQFDAEVTKAYKTDRFLIKRLDGLLDVKAKWNMCLGYSKYGTTRTTSAAAKLRGSQCVYISFGVNSLDPTG